jgi:hypothetical protein
MISYRSLAPVLALVAGLAISAPAQAQPNGNAWGWWRNNDGASVRGAYDNGYRVGYDRGLQDSRGRRYDYRRDNAYRDGDWGYDRRYGDRDDYRRSFQQGFVAGYDAAYYGRGSRYPTYPSYPSDSRYPSYPSYPSYPGYPSSYPGGYGGYGNYGYSEAYDRGYREGVDKGRDDGHDRDQYDPRRQKWYREGDRGYNKRYGSREQYAAAYRQGFLRGYDEGYRQNSYGRW